MLIAASVPALAQDQILYKGDPVDGKYISVGSWGSGSAEDVAKSGYSGSRSLKITARSLFEGGRIDFIEPVDLSRHFANPNAYFQLLAKMQLDEDLGSDPLLEGFFPAEAYGEVGSVAGTGSPVTRVRLVLMFDAGAASECQADVSGFRLGDDGWLALSFPMSALKGKTARTEYKLKRIIISGDGSEPFYIGQIQIVTDTKPITADAGLDQFVAANDDIMFRAVGDGGAAALRYAWDFDSKDGIQTDALGEVVYHKYRKAGDYTITLTVSDIFKIKEPVTRTVKAQVFD